MTLEPVGSDNWREVAGLEVTPQQRAYVATPSYYLALCCYGTSGWRPLAVTENGEVVGFLMWAVDPADGACWLGGVLIDHRRQREGLGKRAVQTAVEVLHEAHGFTGFALSYHPDNSAARALYRALGFRESGEREGDEVVARLSRPGGR